MKKYYVIPALFVTIFLLAACAQALTPTVSPTKIPEATATEVAASPTEVVEPTATNPPPTAVPEPTATTPPPTEVPEPTTAPQAELVEVPFAPGLVAGGIRRVEAASVGEDVRWILPGPRRLDPAIFGSPAQPLGFEPDVGVPLEARLTSDDGSAYTTTAGPTPFSDNFVPVSGKFDLSLVDSALVDGPDSQDQVNFNASFTGPDGKEYTVKLLKVIPKGPVHPFFGGVATNILQHGMTGIGTKLMPTVPTYAAFWGVAELTIDGEVVASNRIIHGMLTSNARDADYRLGFDQDIDNSRVVFHLMMPNTEVTPDGPQESPLPTGFMLPNGAEQPFFHIMFEEISLDASRVVDANSADPKTIQEVSFTPGSLAGGPLSMHVTNGEDVRWILPGPRRLDPSIFGSPAQPLGFEPDVGVPLEARLISDDGSAYTTTAGPTPFSDNFAPVSGKFDLSLGDRSLVDGPDSQDQVDFNASFTGPDGKEYTVKLLKVIPKGPVHPFFGGVATNILQHGMTGIGTKLMPTVPTYAAFWGVAELTIDGEVVASNRVIHGMITSNARDADYRLGFDQDIDNSRAVFHLMMPNTEVTPDGPQESPLPTGFMLPNGAEQPFFHIMFENLNIDPALVAPPTN